MPLAQIGGSLTTNIETSVYLGTLCRYIQGSQTHEISSYCQTKCGSGHGIEPFTLGFMRPRDDRRNPA